ncbi:hypothetical protein OpiT1DRAFT_01493 [Opitutaceae bacterium TAV1]|nr:hypothetical protein OpiT1DRAFT_01493 [Opitutaceae bacterium TAV1]
MKNCLKLAGLGLTAAAVAAPAFAEVAINQYLSVDGYAVAAGLISDKPPGSDKKASTLFNSGSEQYDSAKFGIAGKYKDFGGYVSLLYVPERGSDSSSGILDIYATWTAGDFTVTGGKFLSYLGYESFYPINMTQISYSLVAGIPAYHTGVKVDYAGKDFAVGVAVVDSLQPSGTTGAFFEGDGDFSDVGFEAYVSYTGIDSLTVFVGLGFDTGNNDTADEDSQLVVDIWASYAINEKLTIAGEFTYAEDVANYSWLVLAQYAFTDKISGIARISGRDGVNYDPDDNLGGDDGLMFTLSPTYTVTENLSIRAEVSYTDWNKSDSEWFYGVQALFKF